MEKIPHQAVMAIQDLQNGKIECIAQYYGNRFANREYEQDTVGGNLGPADGADAAQQKIDEKRADAQEGSATSFFFWSSPASAIRG